MSRIDEIQGKLSKLDEINRRHKVTLKKEKIDEISAKLS